MMIIRPLLLVLLVIAAALGVWKVMAADPVPPPQNISTSIGECKVCHSFNGTLTEDTPTRDFITKTKSNEFIRLNESLTWEKHDPHSKAFAVLKSPLGQQMSATLKYDVTADARCLSCHAMDKNPAAKEKNAASFVAVDSLGVACTACHGIERPWQADHYHTDDAGTSVPWRTLPPEEKAKAGLKNLRDPHGKAELCASCHVGNAAEGKVISHAMYAAGHPPLLPFELMSFTADEPQHWGTPFDPQLKKFFGTLPEKTARETFSFRPGEGAEGYAARHVALGAIASLEAEAKLLAAASEQAQDGNLDYARFDCYSCHHDLKIPSDRQARGYDGPPGRPPLKQWNGSLAGVIAAHAAGSAVTEVAAKAKEFSKIWQATKQAAYAKPYGDPAQMKAAAGELAKWCAAFAALLQANDVYSPEESAKLMKLLEAAAKSEKNDPEAAMVLVWAYHSLDNAMPKPQCDWSKLKELLPVSVRDSVKQDGTKPVTAGEIFESRMKRFNDFNGSKFRKEFPPKP